MLVSPSNWGQKEKQSITYAEEKLQIEVGWEKPKKDITQMQMNAINQTNKWHLKLHLGCCYLMVVV